MRYLKIATKSKKYLHLEGVPEEFMFVQSIAERHAGTNEELKIFYLSGMEAAKKFKLETSKKNYDSKVAWVVEQTIKLAKEKYNR